MNESKNKQQNNAERKPYRLIIDEHPKFPGTSKSALIITTDLCKKVSEVFQSAFADYEGCLFEIDPSNGQFFISLVFNHGEYGDEIVACRQGGIKNSSGYKLLDRSRRIDDRNRNGDRYLITEDGKDVITPLLLPAFYNNGKPSWNRIVQDYAERQSNSYYNYNSYNIQQLTQIKFLDIKRLVSLIYGRTINGESFEYDVHLVAPLYNATGNTNNYNNINGEYVLNVTQVDVEEVDNLSRRLGINQGSRIIR